MFTVFIVLVCIVLISGITTRLLEMFFKELWFGKTSLFQNRCFNILNKKITIILFFVIIIMGMAFTNVNIVEENKSEIIIIFIAFAITHLAFRKFVFYTNKSKQTLALNLNFVEADHSNVGRAAAIQYVENYLDHVIPCLPSGLHVAFHKGLTHRISLFERRKNFEFAHQPSFDSTPERQSIKVFPRFFILIPKSGFVNYLKLSDADNFITHVGNLDPVKLTQGTVQNREYINNVYCINGDYKRCFVAEFATPLVSIFEMGKSENKENQELSVLQTKLFYNGLIEYLKTQKLPYDCLIEKIYYDDGVHSHSLSEELQKYLNKVEFQPR